MALIVDSFWRRLNHSRLRDLVRGQVDGRLDWLRSIAESDLPAPLAERVVEVVGKSRLWRREKSDVAAELVAHFQDGLDADQTVDQLLVSFGDARQAASLIRHAKRRNRPLIWHAWRWACWGLIGLILVYVVAFAYLITGRPTVHTDYLKIVNQRAAKVEAENRAWPSYREALLQLGYQDGKSPAQLSDAIDARPTDDNWPILREYLVSNKEALARLRSATRQNHLGFQIGFATTEEDTQLSGQMLAPSEESYAGPHPDLIQILLLHVMPLHYASKLLAADVYRATDSGDAAMAVEDILAMLRIVEHVEESPFLVSGMDALAQRSVIYQTIADTLRDHRDLWSDSQLQRLAHRLAATAEIPARDWLAAERLWFYDLVQRIYTDDGHGNGRLRRAADENLPAASPDWFDGDVVFG